MNDSSEIRQIQEGMDRVRKLAQEMAATDEKHLRWALGIKIILIAFVAIYLGWAYTSFEPIDAEFIVSTAHMKFMDEIPTAKKQVVRQLVGRAPALVNRFADEILKSIPNVGKEAQDLARTSITTFLDPLEKDVSSWMAQFIYDAKKRMDAMFPGVSTYEQITRMRRFMLEDFEAGIKEMGTDIGESVREHEFIYHLKRYASGKNLTPREQLQREIMAIWYVLMKKKIKEEGLELDLTEWEILSKR